MGVRNHHFRKMTRPGDCIDLRYFDWEDDPNTNIDYSTTPTAGNRYAMLPGCPTANLPAAAAGNKKAIVYDETTNTVKFSNGSAWAAIDTSAGTVTLNTAYDAGAILVVDAAGGDLELDLNDASTDKNVQIKNITTGTITTGLLFDTENASAGCILTNAIQMTTSGAGSTIGTALNLSDAGITNALASGVADLAGTNWDIAGATGAGTFVGLDYGSGSLVGTGDLAINTAMFAVTGASGNVSVNSGVFTVAGTDGAILGLSLTGRDANDLAIAASATTNQALTLDAGGSGTITMGGTSTGNITLGQDGVTTQIKLNATNVLFSAGLSFGGAVIASGGIQMNGSLLAMDTDDDSGFQSPSNDQIDVELGGATEFGFEAARLDMNNNDLEECGHITFYECDAFPAGTEVFIGREDDGDLQLNALTGKEIELAIAGTAMAKISNNTVAFQQASTISTSATTLTLTPTTDVVVANTKGLIVGHTAGGATAQTNEFQVLGTGVADGSMTLGAFSATPASGPELNFLRSHDAVIIDGSFDEVDVNDVLGSITWHCDDSSDYVSVAASIHAIAAVTPAANDTPGIMIFSTTADTANTVTEAMRIDATQDVRIDASGLIVGSVDKQLTTAQANEFQVLGTGAADSSMSLGRWSLDANPPALDFYKSRDAVILDGSFAAVANNDGLGAINWYADDGTTTDTPAAQILCEADAAPGTNDMPGRLVFSTTADGANTVTEAMRLSNDQSALFAGTLGINATAIDAHVGIKGEYVETDPGAAKSGAWFNLQVGETAGAEGNAMTGVQGICTVDSTNTQNLTGVLAGLVGAYQAENGSGGAITQMCGIALGALTVDTVTVTSGYGAYIADSPVAGGGVITTQYGVYIADQTSGAADYGIYIAGADTAAIKVAADPSIFKGGVYGSDVNAEPLVLKGNTANPNGAIETEDGMEGLHIGAGKAAGWAATDNYIYLEDFDNAAPAGAPASGTGGGIYSAGGEIFTIDSAGNATQQTPHDKDGYYYFHSMNTGVDQGINKHGRKLTINMEKFVRRMVAKYPGEFDDIIVEEIDETL